MSLSVNTTQGVNTAYNAGFYTQRNNFQPKFVQAAVSTPYNLNHPKASDCEGVKASPVANKLDFLC